jgi:hypothetical protein
VRQDEAGHRLDVIGTDELGVAQRRRNACATHQRQRAAGGQAQVDLRVVAAGGGDVGDVAVDRLGHVDFRDLRARQGQRVAGERDNRRGCVEVPSPQIVGAQHLVLHLRRWIVHVQPHQEAVEL